jgi:hypothetical protein
MKGKIYKSKDGWVINYTGVKYTGGNSKVLGNYNRRISISSVPLHPDDVKTFDKLPQYTPEDGTKVRFKKVKLNPMGREVDPMNLTQNQSGCVWYGKLIPEVEDKEEQKQHLIDIMKGDEELGLYDDTDTSEWGIYDESREIKVEDIFNDEKREKVKRVILQHKTLKDIELLNPIHLTLSSDGHGEFPDGYKLTEKGIQYIIEQLNKEQDGK